jgi:hypothetical protein
MVPRYFSSEQLLKSRQCPPTKIYINYTDLSGKLIFARLLAWVGIAGVIFDESFSFTSERSAVWPMTLTMEIYLLIHLVVLSNMVLKVLSKVPNLVLE